MSNTNIAKSAKKPALAKLALVPEKLGLAGAGRFLCQQCELFRECKTPFVWPSIPKKWTGKLLVLADAPAEDSKAENDLLKKIWRKAGYKDEDVALAYAVRCRPRNNATSSMVQVRACRPYVLQVIKVLRPKVVVGIGSTALRSLKNHGESNITKNRGKQITVPGLE